MAISEEDFAAATVRTEEARRAGCVVLAQHDAGRGSLVLELSTGVQLVVPMRLVEGLAGAAEADLAEIEITPTGLGLHWPRLDADVSVPGLLQGVFGSRRWMASQLGAAGGRASTTTKTAAARENGRKGGRPILQDLKRPGFAGGSNS